MSSAANVCERGLTSGSVQLDQTKDPHAYAAWGRALAALHHRPTAGATAAPLPLVLSPVLRVTSRVPRATGRADAGPIAFSPVELSNRSVRTGVADVVARVSSSDALNWALKSTAATWSATAWIHGEATRTTALLDPPDQRGSIRVELMSVGLGGLGDTDWDLATADDCILRSGLPPLPYATAVLHAYALADGPGRLRRDALAVRMILTSLRLAAAASCSTPSAGTNTWGRPSPAMGHLIRAERISQRGPLGARIGT